MILKVHLSVQILEAALLTVVFRFVSKLLGRAKDSTQVQRLLFMCYTLTAQKFNLGSNIFSSCCFVFCFAWHYISMSMFRCRKVGGGDYHTKLWPVELICISNMLNLASTNGPGTGPFRNGRGHSQPMNPWESTAIMCFAMFCHFG